MIRSLTIPCILAISFSFTNPCDAPREKQPGDSDTIYEVQVTNPDFQSVARVHTVEGQFDPSEVTTITANADGFIEQVFVATGDSVTKDDPIVTISNTEILELIDIKRARIKELQARLTQAQGRIETSEGEDLPTTIEDTVFMDEDPADQQPQRQFGDAGTPPDRPRTVKGLVEVLEANIDSLTKQADALDRQLLSLTQNSPVDGVITKTHASETNKVKQQDKLVEISKTNPLSVKFFLPEDVASFIDKTSQVKVSPKDAPDVSGTGTVYFISPNIDTATGKIEVRAHCSNNDNQIKGGQKADVNVSTRKMDRVIILPKEVLYEEEGNTFVFIVYRNQAKLVAVKTGEANEQGIQIYGDLRVDDPIIIKRPPELKHNSFVRIKKPDNTP
ncbi:MAG: efflux RND transporter periplasmic adaptor subunit [Deltaproteobacteria bacterium]|nr:efflux RND transporter periplasmic adaptor subunit [Deltaproteobacteria bacterium]